MLNQRFALAILFLCSMTALGFGQKGPGINELKKLNKIDVKVGKGPAAEKGDLVLVKYKGSLKNGTIFDSNTGRDANPLAVFIGSLGIIDGMQQGITGMKVGGIRQLEIPDEMGYGKAGSGEKIPPYADLYFEIEVLWIVKVADFNMADVEDLKKGTGKTVKEGDLVDVIYTARLVNGKKIDSREDKSKPVSFRVAFKKSKPTDRVPLKGVVVGMVGMKEGGRRRITMPPDLAFGAMGRSGAPPHSVVVYEIELIRIR